MSERIEGAIEEVQLLIAKLQADLRAQKKVVNSLCGLINKEPIYSADELNESAEISGTTRDRYYGQDIADVIEDILRRRKQSGKGSATVNEIYDAMKAGGFAFNAKNDENAKRGLYVSLGKNPKFHLLEASGTYGLTAWYPAIKSKKSKRDSSEIAGTTEGSADEADDEKGNAEEFAEVGATVKSSADTVAEEKASKPKPK